MVGTYNNLYFILLLHSEGGGGGEGGERLSENVSALWIWGKWPGFIVVVNSWRSKYLGVDFVYFVTVSFTTQALGDFIATSLLDFIFSALYINYVEIPLFRTTNTCEF